MPGIARVGIDSAGGVITGVMQTIARINGAYMVGIGASVSGHGSGAHAGPVMVQGSAIFRVNGIPICLAGHMASCTDQATGDPNHRCSR